MIPILPKKKYITILLISIALLVATSSVTYATRVTWPDTPMGTNFPATGVAAMIKYIYEWGIALGGIAAFIALVIAGFQYLSSAGNPAMLNEAKSRVVSALEGLVLLLGSWLILNTINPQLTNFPKLTLDLSKLTRTTEKKFTPPEGPSCEFAYLYKGKNFEGDGERIEINTLQDNNGYYSVRQMRHIACYAELMPTVKQVIAECTNKKIAEGKSSLECSHDEIQNSTEQFLKDRYSYIKTNQKDSPCLIDIPEEDFGICYHFTLPNYLINDGSCTLQLNQGKFFGLFCGSRVAEISATNSDYTRFTDAEIKCIKLVSYSE